MRGKSVNEFKRGQKPTDALEIGKVAVIKKMLDTIYTDHPYLTYMYNSPDGILVKYKDDVADGIKDDYHISYWIIKYIETPKYFSRKDLEWPLQMGLDNRKKYEYRSVYERKFRKSTFPNDMSWEDTIIIQLPDTMEDAAKKTEIIVDAFNSEYGVEKGFESIEFDSFLSKDYKSKIKELSKKLS